MPSERQPPSSPSLIALAELHPPSPPLCASFHVANSITLQEIPIIFEGCSDIVTSPCGIPPLFSSCGLEPSQRSTYQYDIQDVSVSVAADLQEPRASSALQQAATKSWISELAFVGQLPSEDNPDHEAADDAYLGEALPAETQKSLLTEEAFQKMLRGFDHGSINNSVSSSSSPGEPSTRARAGVSVQSRIGHPLDQPQHRHLDSGGVPVTPYDGNGEDMPPVQIYRNPGCKDLSWLQDMTVNLLIDQEGFRSVQPAFRFIGLSERDKMAQFKPIKKQALLFHYAPFDGAPVLRRMMINGVESRDYITRQASLSLKDEGLYAVCGSEAPAVHSWSNELGTGFDESISNKNVLVWRLDYLVCGRTIGVDGERTMTPLHFSCSPLLLHPHQGKRVKFIHVMKKSVITKLVAEKIGPGQCPKPVSPAPTPKYCGKSVFKHRRVQSHAVAHCTQLSPLHPLRKSKDMSQTDQTEVHIDQGNLERTHRRRASSAGERHRLMRRGEHPHQTSVGSKASDQQKPSQNFDRAEATSSNRAGMIGLGHVHWAWMSRRNR